MPNLEYRWHSSLDEVFCCFIIYLHCDAGPYIPKFLEQQTVASDYVHWLKFELLF
jgi:hypothetical protein